MSGSYLYRLDCSLMIDFKTRYLADGFLSVSQVTYHDLTYDSMEKTKKQCEGRVIVKLPCSAIINFD